MITMSAIRKRNFKTAVTALGLFSGLWIVSACSDNTFTATDESAFVQCLDARPEVVCKKSCEAGVCFEEYDYQIDTESQITDILFVVDNSGSMYTEQVEMGSKFPKFLNAITNLDYRIAITTTDISREDNGPDASNGYGAFQDGKLIKFPNNDPFLDGTYSLIDEQDYFDRTVKRQETQNCNPSNNYRTCPDGNERGILAAAMTLENNPHNFVREVGHMAVVFLSDEDEGSNGSKIVDEVERPNNFVSNFKSLYPNKSIAAHSIIIRPGDSQCFDEQANNGYFAGEYGDFYAELTDITDGILGNICDDNYTDQLESIGTSVAQVREVLPCRPKNDEVTISYDPEPVNPVEVTKNFSQNEIVFGSGLKAGTKIRLQFACENSSAAN